MTSIPRSNYETLDEMHQLVAASLAGNLSCQGGRRLEELVGQSVETCDLYLDIIHESNILFTWATRGGVESETAQQIAASRCEYDRNRTAPAPAANPAASVFSAISWQGATSFFSSDWPLAYLIAAVIVAAGILVASFTQLSQPVQIAERCQPSVAPAIEPKAESVGWITGIADCKWVGKAFDSARVCLGQRYELTSGVMEITYNTGAKVILQAPVAYVVESRNGGFMSVGKLTGKVTTEDAKGFVVRTPSATVTDLGTKFGMDVKEDGVCEVHVLEGRVQTQFLSLTGQVVQTVELKEGEGRRYCRETPCAIPIPADAAKFAPMRNVYLPDRYQQWLAYSRRLRNDPALIAYYAFEHQVNADIRRLPNLSAAGNVLDGQVEGAEWVNGRLPGKVALLFHGTRSGDKVVLGEPQRFRFAGPFSIAVWFKVDRNEVGPCCHGLVVKADYSPRLLQYADNRPLAFDTEPNPLPPDPDRAAQMTTAKTNVSDGQWHLAVATCTPEGATAWKRLYVDGRLEAEDIVAAPLHQSNEPFWIGAHGGETNREFHGLIDEVAFLARTLSDDEVTAMFEAGNPAMPALSKAQPTRDEP